MTDMDDFEAARVALDAVRPFLTPLSLATAEDCIAQAEPESALLIISDVLPSADEPTRARARKAVLSALDPRDESDAELISAYAA